MINTSSCWRRARNLRLRPTRAAVIFEWVGMPLAEKYGPKGVASAPRWRPFMRFVARKF